MPLMDGQHLIDGSSETSPLSNNLSRQHVSSFAKSAAALMFGLLSLPAAPVSDGDVSDVYEHQLYEELVLAQLTKDVAKEKLTTKEAALLFSLTMRVNKLSPQAQEMYRSMERWLGNLILGKEALHAAEQRGDVQTADGAKAVLEHVPLYEREQLDECLMLLHDIQLMKMARQATTIKGPRCVFPLKELHYVSPYEDESLEGAPSELLAVLAVGNFNEPLVAVMCNDIRPDDHEEMAKRASLAQIAQKIGQVASLRVSMSKSATTHELLAEELLKQAGYITRLAPYESADYATLPGRQDASYIRWAADRQATRAQRHLNNAQELRGTPMSK